MMNEDILLLCKTRRKATFVFFVFFVLLISNYCIGLFVKPKPR